MATEIVGAPLVGAPFVGLHTQRAGIKLAPTLKSKIFLSRFFILLLVLFSGCAGSQGLTVSQPASSKTLPPSIYNLIPTGKNLRGNPKFFIIDDFNTRGKNNHLGAPWEIEAPSSGRIRFKFLSQDALVEKRGGSLRLNPSLPPDKRGAFKSSLQGADLSQAEALVLKCRIFAQKGNSFSGKIELRLTDLEGRSVARDFTETCQGAKSASTGWRRANRRSTDWREVIFTRSLFSSVDWSRLKEIAFLLTAAPQTLRAPVEIDEIAFYGKDDVEFRSRRDNLAGFPARVENPERVAQLLAEPRSDKFLYEVARDSWKFFENAIDRNTHLPVDHIRVSKPEEIGSYTTPTNLAMYFLACVSARELGFVSKRDAVKRIRETMETLRLMKRWKGFHYNFYNTGNLQVTRPYVSAVDSGWLAAAWVVLRQAFPKELGGLATRFLEEGNFDEYYDPAIGQLSLGYDEVRNKLSPYHYGLIATEARVASFVGIGKGNLPREHWWFIYRTPPDRWEWQNQKPEGKEVEIDRVTFFEGHYSYQGKKFVPSWGGSLFEFLMPALVMKEKELAPKGLGLNNRIATEIQIDYAINRQGYPLWGISPASTASGRLSRYVEYGVKYLGVKGYRDEGVIAPYAAFLALETLPDQAIDNLRRMLQLYGSIYGEYGFYDSVNVRSDRVSVQYLALDQGMILAAIANYLRGGILKEYFHRDPVAKAAESLLDREEFFV